MAIPTHPINTRVQRDVKNYRNTIDNDPGAKDEVKRHLKKKDTGKWTNPSDAKLKSYKDGFKDFAYWQGTDSPYAARRLGGGLDGDKDFKPDHLGAKLPKPDPSKSPIKWTPPGDDDHPDPDEMEIDVRPDGAIVHEDEDGNELHDVHHYMHAIFDDILYDTRRLLENINLELEAYAEQPNAGNAAKYQTAVLAFEDFLAQLQPGGSSPYAKAFNSVGIAPVLTNEGFIVSCRVKLNWKNPYHSSSTIKIP